MTPEEKTFWHAAHKAYERGHDPQDAGYTVARAFRTRELAHTIDALYRLTPPPKDILERDLFENPDFKHFSRVLFFNGQIQIVLLGVHEGLNEPWP